MSERTDDIGEFKKTVETRVEYSKKLLFLIESAISKLNRIAELRKNKVKINPDRETMLRPIIKDLRLEDQLMREVFELLSEYRDLISQSR